MVDLAVGQPAQPMLAPPVGELIECHTSSNRGERAGMSRILVIDDDEQFGGFIQEALKKQGYDVRTAVEGREGIEALKKEPADLVITDLFMPEMEGCETIIELRRRWPNVRIIAISGGCSIVEADCLPIARALGANCTLPKPIQRGKLIEAVRNTLGDSVASAKREHLAVDELAG